MSIVIELVVNAININSRQPLPLDFLKVFLYDNPEIPVLIEYPLELSDPRFVL